MATLDGTVKKSPCGQKDLQKHKEHCSADARALDALGIAVCQQVRVKRTDTGMYALYTVSEHVAPPYPSATRVMQNLDRVMRSLERLAPRRPAA